MDGRSLVEQRHHFHVDLGLVDHGEKADGGAIAMFRAEGVVGVDLPDPVLEHLYSSGIRSVDGGHRVVSAKEVL